MDTAWSRRMSLPVNGLNARYARSSHSVTRLGSSLFPPRKTWTPPVGRWRYCTDPAGTNTYAFSPSSIASMRTGDFLVGVPEYWSLMAITAQLAANYRLPCRAGGALTDAHSLDIQAGFESAMGLATVIYNGVDFILHAGGALSSFAAFSFEKLVADDEFLGMIRRFRGPLPTSEEAAALEVIASVGPGGSYLMEEHTLDHCRDYDRPTFFNRSNHSSWSASGGSDLGHAAEKRYQKMLQEYEPPEMDKLVKKQLREFCLGDRDSSCSI